MKTDFLMLAYEHDPLKHGYLGFYVSEKLDGFRAMWDGGISRDLPCDRVPYANVTKHGRYRQVRYATGLWTRYGQPIYAPEWFLDSLPKWVILDGELTAGRGTMQGVISCCKSLEPDSDENKKIQWNQIKLMVFDSPSYSEVFQNRRINNSFFKKEFWGIPQWCLSKELPAELLRPGDPFFKTYARMKSGAYEQGATVFIHHQMALPSSQEKARQIVEEQLLIVTDSGGEGLMLRNSTSFWKPERTHDLLKVKKLQDAEGTVIGYKWAELTDMDKSLTGMPTNRLRGLMGSVRLRMDRTENESMDKDFDLGVGFTEEERRMTDASEYNPGAVVSEHVENIKYPRGSRITYRYRELTEDGLPKECRHWRKA